MRYRLTFNDLALSSSADAFKTLLGIIAANTAGYRGRLYYISIGPSDDAPVDENACVRVNRTNNAGAGTAGAAPTPAKNDPGSRASIMTAGRDYSGEPTTYETEPLINQDFNLRSGFVWWKHDPNQMIYFGINQTLGLLVAPRTANARRVSGFVEWEEY